MSKLVCHHDQSSFVNAFYKVLAVLLIACTAHVLFAYPVHEKTTGPLNETPKELEGIGITDKLGDKLDTTLVFKNEKGDELQLASFFHSNKPVILDLAYYGCPSLCNYHLNGVGEALKHLDMKAGKDYEFVVISFDHKEKSDLAQDKKESMIEAYGRVESQEGWHFLTGSEENIKKLADQLGFAFKWVEEEKQFAHASAAYIITPEGIISRYLKGITFKPQSFKLALIEARSGGVSSIVDNLILYCFHYDAKASKYSLAIMNIVRLVGAFTAFVLMMLVIPYWMKNRRKEKAV